MDSCPSCGADLRPGAIACRECGSDERTGWSNGHDHALPEEPSPQPRSSRLASGIGLAVLAAGVVAIASLLFGRGGFALALVGTALVVVASLQRRPPRREDPMRVLIQRLRGDAAVAERLVAAEIQRRPTASREQAILTAIARLENDRR